MGKPTGFLEYERRERSVLPAAQRLRDFAEEIFRIAGTGSVRFTERAAGPEGTPWLFPDISRVTAVTGTEPAVSFREGIREMLPQRRDASGT